MIKPALLSVLVLIAPAAFAADTQQEIASQGGSTDTIEQLLSQGFEIKASAPNGAKFIVFLQKDKVAFACEFANLAKSQCGALK